VGTLVVNAVVLESKDSIKFDTMNVGISVCDSAGLPRAGLLETEIQIRIVDRDHVIEPEIFFSDEVQATDENGNPIFDDDGNPVMIRVPGAARPLGLSGFYKMVLSPPAGGWMSTPFVVEVAISSQGDSGQAFASFADETSSFRLTATSELTEAGQEVAALLTAYSRSQPLRLADLVDLGGETLAHYLRRKFGP
jgi:hypothetical protein